jgi:hypothetical protein
MKKAPKGAFSVAGLLARQSGFLLLYVTGKIVKTTNVLLTHKNLRYRSNGLAGFLPEVSLTDAFGYDVYIAEGHIVNLAEFYGAGAKTAASTPVYSDLFHNASQCWEKSRTAAASGNSNRNVKTR